MLVQKMFHFNEFAFQTFSKGLQSTEAILCWLPSYEIFATVSRYSVRSIFKPLLRNVVKWSGTIRILQQMLPDF